MSSQKRGSEPEPQNSVLRAFGTDVAVLTDGLSQQALRAGAEIKSASAPLHFAYFPVTGVLASALQLGSSLNSEAVMIGHGGAFGAWEALGFDPMPDRIVCFSEVRTFRVPIKKLAVAVEASPRIRQALVSCCQSQLNYSLLISACNSSHTLEERLARRTLTMIRISGIRDFNVSQQDAANALNVQRSYLNTILRDWERAGLIALGRGKLSVINETGLEERSCSCLGVILSKSGPPLGAAAASVGSDPV